MEVEAEHLNLLEQGGLAQLFEGCELRPLHLHPDCQRNLVLFDQEMGWSFGLGIESLLVDWTELPLEAAERHDHRIDLGVQILRTNKRIFESPLQQLRVLPQLLRADCQIVLKMRTREQGEVEEDGAVFVGVDEGGILLGIGVEHAQAKSDFISLLFQVQTSNKNNAQLRPHRPSLPSS